VYTLGTAIQSTLTDTTEIGPSKQDSFAQEIRGEPEMAIVCKDKDPEQIRLKIIFGGVLPGLNIVEYVVESSPDIHSGLKIV
jgi:hypothetical protein